MKWILAAVVYSIIDYIVFHIMNRWDIDRKIDSFLDTA